MPILRTLKVHWGTAWGLYKGPSVCNCVFFSISGGGVLLLACFCVQALMLFRWCKNFQRRSMRAEQCRSLEVLNWWLKRGWLSRERCETATAQSTSNLRVWCAVENSAGEPRYLLIWMKLESEESPTPELPQLSSLHQVEWMICRNQTACLGCFFECVFLLLALPASFFHRLELARVILCFVLAKHSRCLPPRAARAEQRSMLFCSDSLRILVRGSYATRTRWKDHRAGCCRFCGGRSRIAARSSCTKNDFLRSVSSCVLAKMKTIGSSSCDSRLRRYRPHSNSSPCYREGTCCLWPFCRTIAFENCPAIFFPLLPFEHPSPSRCLYFLRTLWHL